MAHNSVLYCQDSNISCLVYSEDIITTVITYIFGLNIIGLVLKYSWTVTGDF